jgi:hypothetical protein
MMEACERVLWDKLLPETEAAINELGSIIQKFEDERAEKAREEEEEKARQESERERERLERLAAATANPEPPQSSQHEPPSFYFQDDGTIAIRQREPETKRHYQSPSDVRRYR